MGERKRRFRIFTTDRDMSPETADLIVAHAAGVSGIPADAIREALDEAVETGQTAKGEASIDEPNTETAGD